MRSKKYKTEKNTSLKISDVKFSSAIFKGDLGIIDDPYFFEANAWLNVTFQTPDGFSFSIKVEERSESGEKQSIDKFLKNCESQWNEKWKIGVEFPHNYLEIEVNFNLEDPNNFF